MAMALYFYVMLVALVSESVVPLNAETLELDGTAEKDLADRLSKEHADYAALEAILGKEPDKKDECDKQKDEYADAIQDFLKTKGKDDGSVQSVKISTDPTHLLPVITKGTACTASSSDDALYWFNRDLVNNVMDQAKALHKDPHKALEDFTKTAQFQKVAENIKYIQERDDVKDMITKTQNAKQIANEWLGSIKFDFIPGLMNTGKPATAETKEG